MLSNASQYAIRSTIYLAINAEEDNKIGVKKISRDLETPQPFLAKLLQQLAKSNLVSSVKGPHGGFYLSEKNKKNSIWDIVKCIDGTEKFDQCFLGLAECNNENPCPVHFIVYPFKNGLLKEFRDKTIGQFAKEIDQSGRILSLKDLDLLKGK